MQDLRLIGVHEDGKHLLLAGPDGEHYTLPLDEALHTAVRRDRPHQPRLQIDVGEGMRPREVQSMVRAGATTEEVADRAGWSVEKVRKYEVPILAERAHIAQQARQVRVRSRGGSPSAVAPTLLTRVGGRLRERGVEAEVTGWDAWRPPEAKNWTVVLVFAAGGRQRQATWVYDPVLRTVEAMDDEARWLSADEPAPAGPLPNAEPRVSSVYDVEAEGGVGATIRRTPPRPDEPVDLMTAMRERTTVGRRSGRRRTAAEAGRREAPQSLPLEHGPPHSAAPDPTGSQPVGAAEGRPSTDVPEVEGPDEELGETVELEPAGAETPPLEEDQGWNTGEAPFTDADVDDPAHVSARNIVEPAQAPGATDEPSAAREADTQPTLIRPAKRKARPSVPSWDDIMFGTKRD
jgi:hypothetical protein